MKSKLSKIASRLGKILNLFSMELSRTFLLSRLKVDNIIPIWIRNDSQGSQQVVSESGSVLILWVEVEQNDVVGPMTDGTSCKTCV